MGILDLVWRAIFGPSPDDVILDAGGLQELVKLEKDYSFAGETFLALGLDSNRDGQLQRSEMARACADLNKLEGKFIRNHAPTNSKFSELWRTCREE